MWLDSCPVLELKSYRGFNDDDDDERESFMMVTKYV